MSNPTEELKVNNNKIINATKWAFHAELFAKMIVPITNIILARILAPDVFGMIAIVNMIVSFIDMFTNAGFQKYLVQHEYQNSLDLKRDISVAFWTNLSLSLFLWGIIIIFQQPIASFVGSKGNGHVIAIACVSLPITSFSSIQESLYVRTFKFKTLFYNRMLVSCLPFIVTIPLALAGFEYWSLIIGTICGNAAKAIYLTIKSEWKPSLFFRFHLLVKMLSFSLWTILEAFTLWLSTWVDIFIVSNKFGSYYTGLYKTTQITVTGILSIITASTTSVLYSSLSRVQNDNDKFINIFNLFQRNVGMLVLPLGVGIFVFKDFVTRLLLSEKWIEASEFLGIWGICTALVATYGTFCREVYRAKGRPKISVLAQILHLIFIIPVCYFSYPFGFHFLIYARSFAFLQIIVVHFVMMKIFIKIPPLSMIKQTFVFMIASTLMGILGMLLQNWMRGIYMTTVNILICCLFYFGILFMIPTYRKIFLSFFQKMSIIQRIFARCKKFGK